MVTTKAQYLAINPDHPNKGIYTPCVVHNGTVYLSGKTSWIAPEPDDITKATEFLLQQIEKELEHAGSSMGKVLKVIVYLRDMNDYAAMNAVYTGRFGQNAPARTTVEAKLPRNSIVGFDVTAYL